MEISYQIKYDTSRPEAKLHALEVCKRELAYGLMDLVTNNREGIICLSPMESLEFPEFDYRPTSTYRVILKYEYARSVPVWVHGGFEYETEHVKPPSKLTWYERISFIFTGKYPRK